MVASQCVVKAEVNTDIEVGKHIPPLRPYTEIEPVSGRGERISSRAEECIQGYRSIESVSIVNQPHPNEAVAFDILDLHTRSEVAVL